MTANGPDTSRVNVSHELPSSLRRCIARAVAISNLPRSSTNARAPATGGGSSSCRTNWAAHMGSPWLDTRLPYAPTAREARDPAPAPVTRISGGSGVALSHEVVPGL